MQQPNMGLGERSIRETRAGGGAVKLVTLALAALTVPCACWSLPRSALVNGYPVHEDGGLIYDPLRREAEMSGQLARYCLCRKEIGKLQVGYIALRYAIARRAFAYDMVPIRYRLTWLGKAATFPVAVEATAFKEECCRKGRNLYELVLHGIGRKAGNRSRLPCPV